MTTGRTELTETEALLTLKAGFAQADQQIGRFNLAIFGMTGVGKSTLVNTVFGAELAKTGVGRPVTRGSQLHRTAGSRMGIYDTEGLEIGRDSAEIVAELERQIQDSHAGPLADQIQVVWYCVRASDRRFTEAESDFVSHICELGPPVLLVITRTALVSGNVPPDTRELANHIECEYLPIFGERVYFVNAQPDEWTGIPSHGLDELLQATSAAAPLGAQRALTAAQQINSARKEQQANQLVRTTATELKLRPLLRDVRATWAEMIAGIAIIYGLPENQAINAALQAREVAAMHRLLYLGQASVVAAPVRYVILGGARAKRSIAGAGRKKSPIGEGEEKAVPTKTWIRKRIRHRRLRASAAGIGGTDETSVPRPDEEAKSWARQQPQRMGSGLAAGVVTLAVGQAWATVCERAYRDSYPEPPGLQPELFAQQFSEELSNRMSKPLLAWRRISTRRQD
jgi:GTP-binding protein EngB required for normal cell division